MCQKWTLLQFGGILDHGLDTEMLDKTKGIALKKTFCEIFSKHGYGKPHTTVTKDLALIISPGRVSPASPAVVLRVFGITAVPELDGMGRHFTRR